MTDREKLIELIEKARCCAAEMCHDQGCVGCSHWNDRPHCRNSFIADHLLANGVTLATDKNDGGKWIKADQPPEDWKGEGGYLTNYYVYTPEYGVDIGSYMKTADKWLCMGIPCNVTHWMPLPEPPKED